MSDLVVWLAIAAEVGALAGMWLAGRMRDSYIVGKADDRYGRTAMCVRGKFYYVVPEAEYVERMLRGIS